jgi:diguanylate cyclase (GGDEF)-like protein
MNSIDIDLPGEPEPLDSPFYIARPPTEEIIYKEIHKPGSVIRIRAPRKMGKTSIVLRLMHHARNSGYRTVYLDFQQAEESIFVSLDKFLRWFSANVSLQLERKPMLDDYWDEDLGAKMSSTMYFQDYLLEQIDSPIVLILNEVNRIFEYSHIAQDFLPLLRAWHEKAQRDEIWQKLRLVIVHSTEVYTQLSIHQSPFNVGTLIKLPNFNLEQIQELARCYGLDWTDELGKSHAFFLQSLVAGHPYLVRLAIYNLVKYPQKNIELLLKEAPTITGIYSSHLREILAVLYKNSELAAALKKVIYADIGVELDHMLAYQLESIGLVNLEGNLCSISCELYRQYFASQNLEEISLQQQVVHWQHLSYTDDITQIANRRYFDIYLKQVWQICADDMLPLSLIKLEVDYFKLYNETCGKQAGDDCLRKIAGAISRCVKNPNYLVARYMGKDFAVILPKKNANFAFKLAEVIRQRIKKLSIYHDSKIYGCPSRVITISLGVACTIVHHQDSPSILENAADAALALAIKNGRDYTCVSTTLNYGLGNEVKGMGNR